MGKIIVIEGTDSSGKETQTKLLYERVKKITISGSGILFLLYSKSISHLKYSSFSSLFLILEA